jgi:F-box protein 18 (helicase)
MKDIKLTKEQEAIVNYPLNRGDALVVEAGAGTGKTTCFIEFSKRKPSSTILYLCFNNKSAKEAQELYKKAKVINTKASTIHGLASKIKHDYTKLGKFQDRVSPKDLEKLLRLDIAKSCLILKTIKTFCESEDKEIKKDHVPTTEGIITLSGAEGSEMGQLEILELSKKVWAMMVHRGSSMPISYDHYLKIYQLSEPFLNYDYILLDEAQDSNPVTLAILENQKSRSSTILIGDKNQAIYGWRGAKDAMGKYESVASLPLTQSFRFGQNIAATANRVLKTLQKSTTKLRGTDLPDSVKLTPNFPELIQKKEAIKPLTYIARTNATLFDKALFLAEGGLNYHFHGTKSENNWDPSSIYKLNDLKDVYHLWCGNLQAIKNPYIKIYGNYTNLKNAAFAENFQEELLPSQRTSVSKNPSSSKNGDTELQFLCRLVEKYKHRVPSLTQTLKDHCVGPPTSKDQNIITLTTAHRSKGLEWDNVEIADDFIKNKSGLSEKQFLEEANLLYVAITRAKKNLSLPPTIHKLIQREETLKPLPINEIAPVLM